MFGKFLNNYYYGKSGKADFTEEDLPTTRMQLFRETLRVRFSALFRLNLMYVVVWIPTIIVLLLGALGTISILNQTDLGDGRSTFSIQAELQAEQAVEKGEEAVVNEEYLKVLSHDQAQDQFLSLVMMTLLLLIPSIAITGPVTAGVSYVTRNWARDEHAFIWDDLKDAIKENWKQGLAISVITSVMPVIVYMCWRFYGSMAATQPILVVPQVLVMMIGILWAMAVTYMYPLIVSYRLRFRDVIRNGLLLCVARLPFSALFRLLHCVPMAIALVMSLYWNPSYGILFAILYYLLFGFALSRFVTASYTNSVFDRFINSRIEGAKVNRGLRVEDDDDGDDDDTEERTTDGSAQST